MKQKFNILLASVFLVSMSFLGCKKSFTDADYTSELATHSDDQTRFNNETDAVSNDLNTVVDNYTAFNGKSTSTLALPCDATVVVDSTSNPRKITITYNGMNCLGTRTRTGVVTLTLPGTTRWKDVGAVLTVTYQNLKITRVSDNKSITINGVKTITNVTGGLVRFLANVGPITHTITSTGMVVTFDDGSQRKWQIAKKRVFSYNNGIVITTTGTGTVDGVNNVSEWGVNRFGNTFITSINQPMIVRQDCNFRLTSGQVTHNKLAATILVTYGLDANGVATTCPAGSYYFKLVFTSAAGIQRTVILPY